MGGPCGIGGQFGDFGRPFLWIRFADAFASLEQLSVTSGPPLERLMMAEVILIAFNMLTAFPMDGDHVARALLATKLEPAYATRIAAGIGQAMALLFATGMEFHDIEFLASALGLLVFLGLFLWVFATRRRTWLVWAWLLGGGALLSAIGSLVQAALV